jgi:hydrogenase-4 component B
MALAGAGLALTAAIAFATFVKVFGVGLLGRSVRTLAAVSSGTAIVVGLLGLCVLALAVGMPVWLEALRVAVASEFGTRAASEMHEGHLLVPLTAKFAFISPTLLVVVMPLLALVPLFLILASRRYAVRRAPVWYGGFDQDPERASTTALTFSNAMRTFYSFIYRPTETIEREARGPEYFVHRLRFSHDVAPIFGPYLFAPITRTVYYLADKLRALQSGHLNFYLALIGGLLVIILAGVDSSLEHSNVDIRGDRHIRNIGMLGAVRNDESGPDDLRKGVPLRDLEHQCWWQLLDGVSLRRNT